ncbi:MAG: cytochrome P450, partial [Bacteroidota bacterium]
DESVEEMLRLCPSAFTRRRITVKDKVIGSRQFRKGDEILLVIGSANRDETIFEKPNEALIGRKNAKRNLTLGRGFHYCIGAKLVKLEYVTIMQAIMEKYPNIQLDPAGSFHYPDNISIRALRQLRVNLFS